MLPLEMRPDSPCESGMQPRVPVAPGEKNSVLDTNLSLGSDLKVATEQKKRRSMSKPHIARVPGLLDTPF